MAECEKCGRPLIEGEERLCPSCKKPWSEATKTASEAGELAVDASKLAKEELKSLVQKKIKRK